MTTEVIEWAVHVVHLLLLLKWSMTNPTYLPGFFGVVLTVEDGFTVLKAHFVVEANLPLHRVVLSTVAIPSR